MAARWGRKAALPMFSLSHVLRVYPAIQQVTYAAGFTADDNSTVSTAPQLGITSPASRSRRQIE
jgi:hypothetical protein